MMEIIPATIPPMQLCLWFLSIIAEAFSSITTSGLLDKGQPQWGQVGALSLISLWHSGHLIKAIWFLQICLHYINKKYYSSTKNLLAINLVSGSFSNSSPGLASLEATLSPFIMSSKGIM